MKKRVFEKKYFPLDILREFEDKGTHVLLPVDLSSLQSENLRLITDRGCVLAHEDQMEYIGSADEIISIDQCRTLYSKIIDTMTDNYVV